jgi:hypothetical protein
MIARFPTILAAALLLVSPNLWAQSQPADPPSRVGRLSAIEGNVQQRTPDDNDWGAANLNYPVSTGFAIAPQDGGRAEIQVGSAALRVGPQSELDVTNLTDAETSLTLAQGELSVRVGEIPRGERIEIVTPRGVMEILAAGQYHLDAGTTESPTRFEVFNGRAEVQRDGGSSDLASGQAALINTDQSLSTAQAKPDPLDQWAFARDRGPAPRTRTASVPSPAPQSAPAPYISPEMTGEADLSAYGSWSPNPDYGEVWYPSGVPAGWAPYTYGHWAWVSPWGWTWIDDEPWGFAPFHYGRWAYLDGGWGWIPGEVVVAPVYAPALVVFIGGPEHRFFWDHDHEGVGWFPLGPREAYVPGYRTSIDYVRNVNRSNVDVRNLNITRANGRFAVNNQRGETVGNFVNHRFATVVPASQFGGTRRVRDVAVHNASVTTAAASLPVSRDPPVTPPRSAAGPTATTRAATLNRTGRPPLPQAHAASAPTPAIAGHSLPALPPAHGNATGSKAPSRFGASARTPTAATTRALPPVPSANSKRGPQGAAINNATPTGRTARGPFGTTRSGAPNVTTGSTGRNVPQVPTTRRTVTRPPTPQSHIAQPSAANTSTGHRGLSAPPTPRVQRNTAAPTHTFAPPPRAQAPVRSVSPPRAPAPPHFAAPAHSAPRAAPARPIGNAAVSHAPAPAPHPAPHPANNNQKKNQG